MTLDDSDGYLKFTVAKAGEETTAELDVVAAAGHFTGFYDAHGDRQAAEFWAAVAAYLSAAGLPPLSTLTMERVVSAVYARVGELRKKPTAAA